MTLKRKNILFRWLGTWLVRFDSLQGWMNTPQTQAPQFFLHYWFSLQHHHISARRCKK